MNAPRSPDSWDVPPGIWTITSDQLEAQDTLLMLSTWPAVYVAFTQEELDQALMARDARYILVLEPGLIVDRQPAGAGAKVATRLGDMTVIGSGVLYLVGEGASASITGGQVYAYDQATIISVGGGRAYAYDHATIHAVTGGEAIAYDHATIRTVTGGEVYVYDHVTVASVKDGNVYASNNARISGVSGGMIMAENNVQIDLAESPNSKATWDVGAGHVTLAGRVVVTGPGGGETPDTVSVYGSATDHIHGPHWKGG